MMFIEKLMDFKERQTWGHEPDHCPHSDQPHPTVLLDAAIVELDLQYTLSIWNGDATASKMF